MAAIAPDASSSPENTLTKDLKNANVVRLHFSGVADNDFHDLGVPVIAVAWAGDALGDQAHIFLTVPVTRIAWLGITGTADGTAYCWVRG